MASKLVCDIDGTSGDDVRAVRFALDGTPYEIDLSAASLVKLSKALEPFITKGRNLAVAPSKRAAGSKGAKRQSSTPEYDKDAFKAWATVNGKWTGKRPANDTITEFLAQQG